MALHRIKKGFDVKIIGAPKSEIQNFTNTNKYAVYPTEFEGIKPRLLVKVGDKVKRGQVLFFNKRMDKTVFRSPCCGTISAINLGARRFPSEILIDSDINEESESFEKYTTESILQLRREDLTSHLLNIGMWPLIKQRPFNKIADPDTIPKAIFVNAANSAPYQADFGLILQGDENYFQAGINALSCLTKGKVYICKSANITIPDFENSETHTFLGKYPSGNTSVHINRISPITPNDTVYTITAQDVIILGKALNDGEIPRTKVVALAGPGFKETARKYYRVPFGASLEKLFEDNLDGDEVRLINGNVMWGNEVTHKTCAHYYGSEYFAIEEDRSRHLLGWTMPGLCQYSSHRLNLSSLLGMTHKWKLGTNQHGSHRAMVVTGWMDKHQPLNIMTDFLIRAAMAHDTDEMIQLGILETDPEDFAIASFVDPHKTDVCSIIKEGLDVIEEEGI